MGRERLFKVEGGGIQQDLSIPYMGQLELDNVPIKVWIIDPDVHGLLYGSFGVVHLPTYYGEVVHSDVMTHDIGMVINGGRGPKIISEPFHKGPCWLPSLPFLAVCHTCTYRSLHFSV